MKLDARIYEDVPILDVSCWMQHKHVHFFNICALFILMHLLILFGWKQIHFHMLTTWAMVFKIRSTQCYLNLLSHARLWCLFLNLTNLWSPPDPSVTLYPPAKIFVAIIFQILYSVYLKYNNLHWTMIVQKSNGYRQMAWMNGFWVSAIEDNDTWEPID